MLTGLTLAFLVVCIFGAFAYGSATLMALRQKAPVWGGRRPGPGTMAGMDGVSLTMFVICTVWFTLNAVAEFRMLVAGPPRASWADLAVFATGFAFPPLIMHVVYRESGTACAPPVSRAWRWGLLAMYAASPAVGVWLFGAALDLWPRPQPFGRTVGLAFSLLFTVTSVYATALMLRRRAVAPSRDAEQQRMSNAMLSLFFLITLAFLTVAWLNDRSLLVQLFDRISRSAPILFLAVAAYFENRFEFYDLVIKRGVMLLAAITALGVMLMAAQPILDTLPPGGLRPWLSAIVLFPAAMLLPWLSRKLSRGLDRLWFGRDFTPVEAVKHLLGAMQPAADEVTLVAEAERRLADIFRTPIAIRVDATDTPATPGVDVEADTPSGGRLRFVAPTAPGARRLLSEDLSMLRSLASMFGLMLETMRLQQRRHEQEQVAQGLRLQASRAELKALRAQINPHFLFNALNAIASLVHTDPARADEVVEQLAEVFRYTLRRSDSEWAPLDQELAFARAYLDVERARFGPRLTCRIDVDLPSPSPQVPSMLLQTLIENAVKHGVSQTRGPGSIEVTVRATAGDVALEVRDNGPGPARSADGARGEGFGLRSVRERLLGHFGHRAALTLERDEAAGQTIARIVMPMARVGA